MILCINLLPYDALSPSVSRVLWNNFSTRNRPLCYAYTASVIAIGLQRTNLCSSVNIISSVKIARDLATVSDSRFQKYIVEFFIRSRCMNSNCRKTTSLFRHLQTMRSCVSFDCYNEALLNYQICICLWTYNRRPRSHISVN